MVLPLILPAKASLGLFIALMLAACGGQSSSPSSQGDISFRSPVAPQSLEPPCLPDASIDLKSYTDTRITPGRDPLEDFQWYLDKLEVRDAWGYIDELVANQLIANDRGKGQGIEIAIVDDNVQLNHEDLAANVIEAQSVDSSIREDQVFPVSSFNDCVNGHGTAVAGIITAAGDNKRGIRGIAYKAKFWASNLIHDGSFGTNQFMQVFSHRLSQTSISSNSWGFGRDTLLIHLRSQFRSALERGLSEGFDGKGISYVFSAGNGAPRSMASYQEILNLPGVIPVCAVGSDDNRSSFSETGPNLWVCAYSKTGRRVRVNTSDAVETPAAIQLQEFGIPTTDLSGARLGNNRVFNTVVVPRSIDSATGNATRREDGVTDCTFRRGIHAIFNFASPEFIIEPACQEPHRIARGLDWYNGTTGSYQRYFDGTSAAAPQISGIIALMRSVNSQLSWRDVKLILAGSARHQNFFTEAGATYHNASENYYYHHEYGFGIANASKAVRLAQDWKDLPALPQLKEIRIPTSGPTSVDQHSVEYAPIGSQDNISFVEYVQVRISGPEQPDFGDLHIELISPQGARSVFAVPHLCLRGESKTSLIILGECPPAFGESPFVFGSALSLGENPQGTWELNVTTSQGDRVGLNWQLILHGHERPQP